MYLPSDQSPVGREGVEEEARVGGRGSGETRGGGRGRGVGKRDVAEKGRGWKRRRWEVGVAVEKEVGEGGRGGIGLQI